MRVFRDSVGFFEKLGGNRYALLGQEFGCAAVSAWVAGRMFRQGSKPLVQMVGMLAGYKISHWATEGSNLERKSRVAAGTTLKLAALILTGLSAGLGSVLLRQTRPAAQVAGLTFRTLSHILATGTLTASLYTPIDTYKFEPLN